VAPPSTVRFEGPVASTVTVRAFAPLLAEIVMFWLTVPKPW